MTHVSSATLLNHRRTNPLAMGLVVLLHMALVVAIGNGLGVKPPLSLPPELWVSVIESPALPTPPPKPPTTIEFRDPPVRPIEPAIVLPPVEGAHSGITQKPAITETKPTEPTPTKAVTPPAIDPRHPLTQPAYPASSRRAGEEGTVELMLYVLADGRIGDARVARSSGFHRLDEAAVKEALRRWRLRPQREEGAAVSAWHKIAVTFRLES